LVFVRWVCSLPCAVFFVLLAVSAGNAQSVAPVSPSAVDARTVLSQVLSAAGWSDGSAQDFSASGPITFFWAGRQVKGTASVYGRGADQFKLEAVTPEGTRTFVSNNGLAQQTQLDGTTVRVPYQNSINASVLTMPFPRIVSSLSDPMSELSLVEVITVSGVPVYRIRIKRNFEAAKDPGDVLSKTRVTDYFIDSVSLTVLKTKDTLHADNNALEDYTREILFGDYRSVNGRLVPFAVAEEFAGQRTWQLALSAVSFNTGLSDSTFAITANNN
jgi:hypothetical protein